MKIDPGLDAHQKKHRCVRFFRPFGNCCYRRTVAPVTSSSESLAGVTSSTQLVWVFTTDSRSEHARNQSDRSLEILLLRLGTIRSNDLKIISVESASFTSSRAPVFTLGGVFCQCFAVPMGLMQLYRCIDHKSLHYPYSASWLSTPNWWFTTHCLLSISLGWLKVFEQKPGGTMVLTVLTYLLGETHQDREVNPASLMMLYFLYFGVSLYITVSTATLQQTHVAKGNPLEMEVLTGKSSFILAIIHCRFTVSFPSSDSSRLAKLFTQGGITWPNGHSSVWPFGRALRWALAHGSWLVGTG